MNDKVFFQMYWVGTNKERMLARVERARAAGAKALIVTLDWSFATRRDWGSPPIPEKLDFRAMVKLCRRGITPAALVAGLRQGRPAARPDHAEPGTAGGETATVVLRRLRRVAGQPPLPSWDDVKWLRDEWGGPFIIKGIMQPDDAKRRAVDIGATAISVSNHGGNNLDGTPATIRALPAIADAVGDRD